MKVKAMNTEKRKVETKVIGRQKLQFSFKKNIKDEGKETYDSVCLEKLGTLGQRKTHAPLTAEPSFQSLFSF